MAIWWNTIIIRNKEPLIFFKVNSGCNGIPRTDYSCCSPTNTCDYGQGNCHYGSDTECTGALICGRSNCLAEYSSADSDWTSDANCCKGKPYFYHLSSIKNRDIEVIELFDHGIF